MSLLPRLPCVFDTRYCTTAAPTISTTKQAEVVRVALQEGLLDLKPWTFNDARTWAGVERVHEAAYVRAVRSGRPRSLAESQGFTWSPEFAEAVARIWAGHLFACRLALVDGVVFHPVSGAHHARRKHGAGFCTFNFLVGAGLAMLDGHRIGRVAIVDLDAHQGDGTHALVGNDRRFGLFDVAGQDWIGEEESDRVTLSVVGSAEDYATALSCLPAFLDRFEPDLVEYQAGMDCHQDDPVGGIAGVDAAFLARRDRFVIGEVVRRGIPLVINLAGGYQSGGTTVALHVETMRIAAGAYSERLGDQPDDARRITVCRTVQPMELILVGRWGILSAMSSRPVWTMPQAARLLGEPPHRLIYLCEKRVVVPDYADASGRGSSRRFSARNLLEFAIAFHLRTLALPVGIIAAIVYTLRAFEKRVAVEIAGFELVTGLRGGSGIDLRAILGDGERLYFLLGQQGKEARLFGGIELNRVNPLKFSNLVSRLRPVPMPTDSAKTASFAGPEGSRYVRLDINIGQIARDLKLEE